MSPSGNAEPPYIRSPTSIYGIIGFLCLALVPCIMVHMNNPIGEKNGLLIFWKINQHENIMVFG